jgi:hypothetical protein
LGRYLCAARARSSVVELWFYTPAVGGSIPSAPTIKMQFRHVFSSAVTALAVLIREPVGQECPKRVASVGPW